MSLLSASQISLLKTQAKVGLEESAELHRRTLTATDSGGVVASAANFRGFVDCKRLPSSAVTREQAGGTPEVMLSSILVDPASDIIVNDELVIEAERYLVVGVISRWPDAQKRLECTRL